jgi:hypothetical protein
MINAKENRTRSKISDEKREENKKWEKETDA